MEQLAAGLRGAVGGRATRMASAISASMRSSRCGSRSAIAAGSTIWRPDTRRSMPASTASSTSPSPTSSAESTLIRERQRADERLVPLIARRSRRRRRTLLRAGACRRRAGRVSSPPAPELHARARAWRSPICATDLAAPGSSVEIEIFGDRRAGESWHANRSTIPRMRGCGPERAVHAESTPLPRRQPTRSTRAAPRWSCWPACCGAWAACW